MADELRARWHEAGQEHGSLDQPHQATDPVTGLRQARVQVANRSTSSSAAAASYVAAVTAPPSAVS